MDMHVTPRVLLDKDGLERLDEIDAKLQDTCRLLNRALRANFTIEKCEAADHQCNTALIKVKCTPDDESEELHFSELLYFGYVKDDSYWRNLQGNIARAYIWSG